MCPPAIYFLGGITNGKSMHSRRRLGRRFLPRRHEAGCSGYGPFRSLFLQRSRSQNVLGKHGIQTIFTDLEKLAKSDEVDAVYIANPNSFHYATAKILLENGKHVLCEKTCVVTSEQLKNLYEIADKNGVIFMEAMKGIYMPEIQVINEAMKKIGDIHMLKLDFCRYSSKYPEYREGGTPNIFNPKMAAGGLMDMGIYLIYPAIYWFGVPEKIMADASILRTGADACGTVLFHSAGNVHITMSYGKASTSHHENLIMGDIGVIHMDSVERFDNCYIEYFDGKKENLITRDLSVNPWGPGNQAVLRFHHGSQHKSALRGVQEAHDRSHRGDGRD